MDPTWNNYYKPPSHFFKLSVKVPSSLMESLRNIIEISSFVTPKPVDFQGSIGSLVSFVLYHSVHGYSTLVQTMESLRIDEPLNRLRLE